MGLKKEIAQNNIIFTAGNLIASIVGFIASVIIARLLLPYEFGLYSFAFTVIVFFSIFSDFGLNSTLVRFGSNYITKKSYGKLRALFYMLLKYKLILILITSAILILFSNSISVFVFNKPEAGIIVFLSGFVLLLEAISEFFRAFLSAAKNFKAISALIILNKILRFVLPLLFILLGLKAVGAVIGLGIADIIIIFIVLFVFKQYVPLIRKAKVEVNKKSLIKFSFWVFIASVSLTVFSTIDLFMISILRPIEDIGFYKIAHTWTFTIVNIIPISAFVLYPYFSGSRNKEQSNIMFFDSLKYISIMAFPIAFLLSAFSGPIINIFYTEAFAAAGPTLMILGFSVVALLISSFMVGFYSGMKRPDIPTKIVSTSLVINIILNIFLIPMLGIIGAAIATLISRIFEVGSMLFISIVIKKYQFNSSIMIKPLIASFIVYYLTLFIVVNTIYELIFYGLASLVIYILIMFGLKGIVKDDVKTILEFLKPTQGK